MMLTLAFQGLPSCEQPAIARALDKLVADYDPITEYWQLDGNEYLIETDDPAAWGGGRERDVEQATAEAIAKAITAALPRERFAIRVTIEHDCSGCKHSCQTEEWIWSTDRPASPESMKITRDMLAGVLP